MSAETLAPELAGLVRLSGALATRDSATIRGEMAAALDVCVPDEVEEAILQSYLFLGYPAALAAFGLWRELSGRPAPPRRKDDRESWRTRGDRVCRAVYGRQFEALRRNVAALHVELGDWMVEEGYGKVLGREGLGFPARELCIVGLLAVLHAPDQLHSHLRGALAVGVDPGAVEAALREADPYLMPEAHEAAWSRWREVIGRRRGSHETAPGTGNAPGGPSEPDSAPGR
ncbi:MAG: carboxymuconolactone decarboxylase family protein [Gemmatimonadota bacterium]